MVKELLSNPYDYDIYKSPEFINEAEVRQIIMGAVRGRLEPDGRTVAPETYAILSSERVLAYVERPPGL
mgnify:CR=1 FL=1